MIIKLKYDMISFKYFLNIIILSIIILGFGYENTHKNIDQVFPSHLKGYEKVHKENPRQASLDWFQDARFGMMICYGLVSVDARHEFEQWKYKIPVKEYEKKPNGSLQINSMPISFVTLLLKRK